MTNEQKIVFSKGEKALLGVMTTFGYASLVAVATPILLLAALYSVSSKPRHHQPIERENSNVQKFINPKVVNLRKSEQPVLGLHTRRVRDSESKVDEGKGL